MGTGWGAARGGGGGGVGWGGETRGLGEGGGGGGGGGSRRGSGPVLRDPWAGGGRGRGPGVDSGWWGVDARWGAPAGATSLQQRTSVQYNAKAYSECINTHDLI